MMTYEQDSFDRIIRMKIFFRGDGDVQNQTDDWRHVIKRSVFVLLITVIAMMLNGCFIPLPAAGPPGCQEHVGRRHTLQRDILVISYLLTPISWEVADGDRIGANQKIIATLKAGSEIKIVSVKSFRLPPGICHGYRCIDLSSGLKFDLRFAMLDCIGIQNKWY